MRGGGDEIGQNLHFLVFQRDGQALLFHLLEFGDVLADELVFDDLPVFVDDGVIAPLMPAHRAIGHVRRDFPRS